MSRCILFNDYQKYHKIQILENAHEGIKLKLLLYLKHCILMIEKMEPKASLKMNKQELKRSELNDLV